MFIYMFIYMYVGASEKGARGEKNIGGQYIYCFFLYREFNN